MSHPACSHVAECNEAAELKVELVQLIRCSTVDAIL